MIDAEEIRRQFEHISWQVAELMDENAKLRKALEYIAAYNKPLYDSDEKAYELGVCQQVAREALK